MVNEELAGKVHALEERISLLSAAILRISQSLDLSTVLQEVVDSACALTGARYGAIVAIDEAREVLDYVISGFTEEEQRQLAEWPDGPRLFAHLRDLPGPLRITDLPDYVHKRGFSPELMRSKTLQAMPMRHRGEQVGNFFLAEKANAADFTDEDEELLMLFAAQAATAIANARTYRDEQRARADLEALVETSPVGVVVFHARTKRPISLNHEAKRIAEGLRMPDRSPEQLLEVISYRRADGAEVSLSELPIVERLIEAETVRAEEIVLSAPDGRSIAVLVNATPIRSTEGEVISVVITVQDLAPLKELDRQRSEFLSLVSHELRAPLAAIKGSTAILLGNLPERDSAEDEPFFRVIDEQADQMHRLISDLLDVGRIEAGMLSVSPAPADLPEIVERARSAFLSGGSAHAILIDLPRDLPLVQVDGRRIVQVLSNLLSNAARNSPGPSPIRVAAVRDDLHVEVSVTDEGRGIPPEQLPRLFRKYAGAGSGDAQRDVRGNGLGLSICKGIVEAHGGRIWAESGGAGQGARFSFTLVAAEEAGGAADAGRIRSGSLDARDPRVPILAVDDDAQTLRFVREVLIRAGYSAVVTSEHRELSRLIRTHQPRLILLDLMLRDADGIELLETVPEIADLPVIFISAYGGDETIAKALERGAVDYIVKPFSAAELTARIRAALRERAEPAKFTLGDLTIRYEQRRVTLGGRDVRLTPSEYELLRILSMNAGKCMTYDALIRRMWKRPDPGHAGRVRTFVKQLRRKLGDDPQRPLYIVNVRGVGYSMAHPPGA